MSQTAHTPAKQFRILCVDGGGMRGLISALVLAELERRLAAALGRPSEEVRIADRFHLLAGTSTGGLIALALAGPERLPAAELASFYTEDGPRIFHRGPLQKLRSAWGLAAPKYTLGPLREAVGRRLGEDRLSEATRDLLVTSYDMTNHEPHFFKRWRARQSAARDHPILDAALATSAAPTYFPAHELDGRALVDGGVFAANPVIAALAEALGRSSDPPAPLNLADLFVVSIGTGEFETGFSPRRVSGWGEVGWVAGGGGDPPLLGAMLGGSADGAHYWAHMLLNHSPGDEPPHWESLGHGPRYFRLQTALPESIAMDDASPETATRRLPAAAAELIDAHGSDIERIVAVLAAA